MGDVVDSVRSWLDENLPGLAVKHGVPGAAVGVLVDNEVVDAAAGVLNTATGVGATSDSLFQIGSVTKLWTATLIMQLVEESLLDLDAPVVRYLPNFTVGGSAAAAETITARQLVNHTSGISEDFTATTRGDDAVERYVADVVPSLAVEFRPGERFQYSNPAYAILGHIAEVLRGKPFSTLLREHIGTPLGLRHWAPLPEDALLYRTAVGHIPVGDDGALGPAPVWSLAAALAPAGSQLAMSPRDLLAFSAAYLNDGDPLLSKSSVEQIFTPAWSIPDVGGGDWQLGLGWSIQRIGGSTVVGGDGGTLGQSSSLRLVPEAGVAVVSMANGGNMFTFHHEVVSNLLSQTVDIELPGLPVPPDNPEPVDADFVSGRYVARDLAVEITVDDDGYALAAEQPLTASTRALQALFPGPELTKYVRLDAHRLIAVTPTIGVHSIIVLNGDTDQPATSLFGFRRTLKREPVSQPRP